MHVRSFCLLTFGLPSLAALALPPSVHAASIVDCAAALRIALPNAHITAASAVPSTLGARSARWSRRACVLTTHGVVILGAGPS